MNTIVEIDRAGRIVVPKKFRDALRLKPGTRLKIERNGEQLVLEQDFPEPRLERRDGILVLVSGAPLSGEDVNRSIEEDRERRMRYVAGLSDEP
jgi:AbrB family looped-hinge helix DNA binding protein